MLMLDSCPELDGLKVRPATVCSFARRKKTWDKRRSQIDKENSEQNALAFRTVVAPAAIANGEGKPSENPRTKIRGKESRQESANE